MPVNSHKFHQPFRYLRSILRDLCGAERDFRPVNAKHGHCNPCIDDICNIQARSPNEMAASESAILFASQNLRPSLPHKICDPRTFTKSATSVAPQNIPCRATRRRRRRRRRRRTAARDLLPAKTIHYPNPFVPPHISTRRDFAMVSLPIEKQLVVQCRL